MVRTQIQLTDEQAEALRALAAARKVSLAELVREAVDSKLQAARLDDPRERRRRAIEVAGMFSSGRADVSERHDDYLADAFEGEPCS